MNTWGWILFVVVAWGAVAAVVAVVVGRAVKMRDEKERGPRGVPDFVPGQARDLARHGMCVDLDAHRRSDRHRPDPGGEHRSGR
ncbi:hypothetical protein NWF34_18540 [Gordonia sp. GONU]|uniref:hypothetical protein n=1 Tax=Gordonia sp. GONU TaxID=2972949 RepID=UPI0021AC45DA|nr:hypothetical protein [Gordonia sp. GONU]MCR8898947.1 hypothetical protein [Gordonia sp. GONU]